MFDLENLGLAEVAEYNIRSDAIQLRIPTSIKIVARNYTLALTVSDMLRFEMSDNENLGQSHGLQDLQWTISTANINVYKSYALEFSLTHTVFQILEFQILSPRKE